MLRCRAWFFSSVFSWRYTCKEQTRHEVQTQLNSLYFTKKEKNHTKRREQHIDLLDSIVGSETNPVRDGLVVLLGDGQGSLGSEALLGRLK
jgi:hypothetical protein